MDSKEKIMKLFEKFLDENIAKIEDDQAQEQVGFTTLGDLKPGEHFIYHDIEWIALGDEQGGVLAITADIQFNAEFDKEGYNKFSEASIKSSLAVWAGCNVLFDDLLNYTVDMTDDRGCKLYGSVECACGLLTADLRRRYFDQIPNYKDWWWLATPWYADEKDSGDAGYVRDVGASGVLSYINAGNTDGVVPACIFKPETEVERKD